MATTQMEEITGTVQHLFYQQPHFCAGKMRVEGRGAVSFAFKGFVRTGDTVTFVGSWETHAKYGEQFQASSIRLTLPTTPEGLTRWLEWNVPKVGPVMAGRLIAEFGTDLMDKCGSDPEAIAIFARLPIETVEEISKKWVNDRSRISVFTFLAGLGLTQRQCEAIVNVFGHTSPAVVQEDPFELQGRVEGFGWLTTDALAKTLGLTDTDPRRLRGALKAAVREEYDRGSTCINVARGVTQAAEKLSIRDTLPIQAVIDIAVEKRELLRFGGGTEQSDYLATGWAHKCESYIWRTLARSREPNPFGCDNDLDAMEQAEEYRELSGDAPGSVLTLDDKQLEAVAMAIRYRISVITGGAGSGKTQISKSIVKYFTDGDVPVYLCAPTGKAARRMAEVIGRPASTIHRLLQFNGGTGQFEYGEHNQFVNCAILVDEASMVDCDLAYRLLSSVGPRCAVIFVGDPYQLPPVGPGSMLRDIISHDLAPVTRLEKCHRQAGALKENSVAVLNGCVAPTVVTETPSPWIVNYKIETPAQVPAVLKALYEKYLPEWGFHPIDEAQIMTAKHDGGFGTKRLNLLLQHLHQNAIGNAIAEPDPDAIKEGERVKIYIGDKVIQTRNNYDLNVMNGEVGVIRGVDMNRENLLRLIRGDQSKPLSPLPPEQDEKLFKEPMTRFRIDTKPVVDYVIDFPDRRVVYPLGTGGKVELAYCLTTHKLQGSQYPCTITFVTKSSAFMQSRSWLYTSVTRAQRTSVIVGDEEGITRAVKKVIVDERQTLLRVFSLVEESRP